MKKQGKCDYCKSTRLRKISYLSESLVRIWTAYACVMCGKVTFDDN